MQRFPGSAQRREESPDEIPVPCRASLAGPGILQRLVLQPVRCETNGRAVLEEQQAIGADEMRHGCAQPDVAVQPQSAVHGVDHPVATVTELAPDRWPVRGHQRCLLRIEPVVTDSGLDNERDTQFGCVFHFLNNHRAHRVQRRDGDLEDQFVVHLHQHAGAVAVGL